VLRDFFPQWAIDQGLIGRGSLIEKYFRYFERINYKAATIIGVMSAKNLDLFKQAHPIVGAKLEVLYNWASTSAVQVHTDYKNKLGLADKVVYFYGGNIGHAQDMANIMRLAQAMQIHNQAHFVLVGAGDEVELVRSYIDEHKLSNVTLLDAVDQETFKQMLASFDVGLFSLHPDHTTHNFPGKLLGYMVQSMPILGSINSDNDLKTLIDEYQAGLVSINKEDDLFLAHATKLLDADFRAQLGSNAYKLLNQKFSVKSAVKQIIDNNY
jgi:glycosyltransferase involved in cell wall biosynthesis